MGNATIPKFDPNIVPDVLVRVDYNDDLHLGPFGKSNKIWDGAQKKGPPRQFPGSPVTTTA